MMLENLHIQNFRLFHDFKIENLARVNLIVGKNNVGKSSFLEAVGLLVSSNSLNMLASLLENRGEISLQDVASEDLRFPGRFRGFDITYLFYEHELIEDESIILESLNTPYILKISYVQDVEQLSLLADFDEMDLHNLPSASYLLFNDWNNDKAEIKIPLSNDAVDIRRLARTPVRGKSARTTTSYITTKGFEYGELASLWDTITLTPKEDDVIRMLQILEPEVERISFTSRQTSNSGILIKKKHNSKPVPLGNMGDGMHRILTIAATLSTSENGYLLVDEIDTGLHYRTITDMWRLVMETADRLNVQVFATTHSWDCVRSFAEALEMQEDSSVGALFRLEKRGEEIAAVKYTAHDLSVATRQSIEVR